MPASIRSLCVFCGANPGSDLIYTAMAYELGEALANRKIRLVYGGGSVGMMGAVAEGCLHAGGEVVGVIPQILKDRELGHKGITRMETVANLAERKQRMADLSDAFVTLPGGLGTLNELFEMLDWRRIGIHEKPTGLLNVSGFYDDLIAFCDHVRVQEHFIASERGFENGLISAAAVSELLEKLEQAVAATS